VANLASLLLCCQRERRRKEMKKKEERRRRRDHFRKQENLFNAWNASLYSSHSVLQSMHFSPLSF